MFDQARIICRALDKPRMISFKLYYTAFWRFLHIGSPRSQGGYKVPLRGDAGPQALEIIILVGLRATKSLALRTLYRPRAQYCQGCSSMIERV
jgi:hypothetical protein